MADKSENFIYVPVCKRCYKTHPNPVTYSIGKSGEVLTVEKFTTDDEEDGETLSSTEEMSSDSDVEMTDSFIVDDADSEIPDSDDSYELSDDDSSSS